MSAAAVWEYSVVGIGFVFSIWLIGLIVEEDPFSRMPFALSDEDNLAESHSVDDGDLALGAAAAKKRQLSAAPPAHPETPWFLRIPSQQRRPAAHGPDWRVLERATNTLVRGLLTLW
ncbi:MAG: hypothetical protein P1T08_08870 [Acidimicrobiia bacterium]|nr:hypothetical protein [Acidimicrobiia bacterium]